MENRITPENKENFQMNFDDVSITPEFETFFDNTPLLPCDIDNFDIERQKILILERYGQDTKERKLLSHWVIIVVSAWLFITVFILAFNRLLRMELSDTVCCMLLGTTTANILGLAFIVLKGLFPENKK
jgi:hypothetical protein